MSPVGLCDSSTIFCLTSESSRFTISGTCNNYLRVRFNHCATMRYLGLKHSPRAWLLVAICALLHLCALLSNVGQSAAVFENHEKKANEKL